MNFIYRWLHDKRMAEESTRRSKLGSEESRSNNEGTPESGGSVDAGSTKVQIPDPWL